MKQVNKKVLKVVEHEKRSCIWDRWISTCVFRNMASAETSEHKKKVKGY